MPELPEIEIIKNYLNHTILYKKIIFCLIRNKNFKLHKKIPFNIINIKNKLIINIKRRGRYLIFILKYGCIVIHLGMTGKLNLLDYKNNINKYNYNDYIDFIIKISFKKFVILRYNDYRKLGFFLWYNNYNDAKIALNLKLGIEPLNKLFNLKYLLPFLKSKRCIKNILMDNKIITGIGNIYANEILYASKINPNIIVNKLKRKKIFILIKIIKSLLLKAINLKGSTINNYNNLYYKSDNFRKYLKVYKRKKLNCYRCKIFKIKYIKISGKGTYYCNNCQL